MKRAEFIDALEKLTFCKGLVTDEKVESINEAGDKFYKINVRLIKGNVIEYRDIQYVVIGDGTVNEEVYFLNEEPIEASIGIAKTR